MGIKRKIPFLISLGFFTLAWVGWMTTDEVHEGAQIVGLMWLAVAFILEK